MKVEKVKGTIPGFYENIGPFESVNLGLKVDGNYVNLGCYYFGPHMDREHEILFKKMERFVDECVAHFKQNSEGGSQ